MENVLHHLAKPRQTSAVWAVVGRAGQCCSHGYEQCDHCILLSALCDLCTVELCARHFPRRDSSYIRSFLCLVPPTLSILSRTMALARGNQKPRLPVFSVCCIMIFRSGEVKVACDSIVYGHGYYQMLPVLYEPQTFLNTIFKPSQSVCTSSCSNCTSPEITNVPLAFIQLI